jgi:hypothetical protein
MSPETLHLSCHLDQMLSISPYLEYVPSSTLYLPTKGPKSLRPLAIVLVTRNHFLVLRAITSCYLYEFFLSCVRNKVWYSRAPDNFFLETYAQIQPEVFQFRKSKGDSSHVNLTGTY